MGQTRYHTTGDEPLKTVHAQGTAPIRTLLLQYSLPAIAGFLVNALYQLVDRILVGRGIGTEAMAAVTCAFPITILTMGIGLLLGTGTGNQISTFLGQGRKDDAEAVLGQSVRLALVLGIGVAIALVAFADPILRASGATGSVLEMAVPYLRITALGQIPLILIISMGNILRVQGRPGLGLLFMAGGNVLNAILATVAIFVLRWGIPGAALATTLAISLNFVLLLRFVQGPTSVLRIRRRHLGHDRALALSILKLGAPLFVMQILGTAVFLSANHGALLLDGPRGVALIGVFNTISMLLVYPPLGVAQAMQPLVAYNRGAGRPDRVRKLLFASLVATTAMGLVSGLAVAAMPGFVASWFTRTDTRLVELAREGLPWMTISVALFGIQGTASHYFLSIHRPGKAAFLLLGRQILAIPLFLILPGIWGFTGLYLVTAISDAPFAILAAIFLRREWRELGGAGPAPADDGDPDPSPVPEPA